MRTRSELRAADADRQAAAERLGSALAEGWLDLDEYDQRARHAYAARTYGDLDRLVADLPPTTAPRAPRASSDSLPVTAAFPVKARRRRRCCW